MGAQAGWLASSFNETAKEFYDKTTEASRRLALWGPLGSYLEGVAEVFETSACLGLSQEKLLNEGFDWLLPACRQSELHSALGFLQIVLSQLRYHQTRLAYAGLQRFNEVSLNVGVCCSGRVLRFTICVEIYI